MEDDEMELYSEDEWDYEPEEKEIAQSDDEDEVSDSVEVPKESICPACSRLVDTALVGYYVLQACKHNLCRECASQAIASGIESEHMGIPCPVEGCGSTLSRQDIRATAGQAVLLHLDDLAMSAISKLPTGVDRKLDFFRATMEELEAAHQIGLNAKVETVVFEDGYDGGYRRQESKKEGYKPPKDCFGEMDAKLITVFRSLSEEMKTSYGEGQCLPYTVIVLLCLDNRIRKLLGWLLRNDSIMDMGLRCILYFEVFFFIRSVIVHPELFPLLLSCDPKADCWNECAAPETGSLIALLRNHYKQACYILGKELLIEAEDIRQEEVLMKDVKNTFIALDKELRTWKMNLAGSSAWFKDGGRLFAENFRGVAHSSKGQASSSKEAEQAKHEEEYIAALKQFQFRESLGLEQNHYFRLEKWSPDGGLPGRMRRISKEIAALASHLPLEYHSSIHVRVHEWRTDMIRALIIGPQGTPYQDGIFLFDIFMGQEYPHQPPKVQFLTTGDGKVRFNPNLYSNGEVCLSLLGTWSGPAWMPASSTVLQVLVSIQSLIFVEHPYVNEPAYYTTSATSPECVAYDHDQRYNTVKYSILPALESPDVMFDESIALHFKYKKQQLISTCEQWLQSYGSKTKGRCIRPKKDFEGAVCRVRELLNLKFP